VLALFADIHSNLEALRACLAHARAHGAERFAFLGDLVGYGADPGPVLDLVADYAARGAIVVKGNHDEAVAGSGTYLNETARTAIRWTRGVLTTQQKEFLVALPLCVREEGACFVHASAAFPERWDYVDGRDAASRSMLAAGTDRTYSGHVHLQRLYVLDRGDRAVAFTPRPGVAVPIRAGRRALALAGSVGQPRDGNTAAAYSMADEAAGSIAFHRVPYDNVAAARKVRAAGLPEGLAYRLERGI